MSSSIIMYNFLRFSSLCVFLLVFATAILYYNLWFFNVIRFPLCSFNSFAHISSLICLHSIQPFNVCTLFSALCFCLSFIFFSVLLFFLNSFYSLYSIYACTNKKINKNSEENSCCSTMGQHNESHKRIFPVYKYSASISALFERNFSTHPILVRLEFHNASAFNIWLHNRRPLHRIRQHDAEDSFDFEHGLLYRDACSLKINLESTKLLQSPGNVIAVEIKPKQGWNICALSGSLLNLFGIDEPVRVKCRFCAMQFLKV